MTVGNSTIQVVLPVAMTARNTLPKASNLPAPGASPHVPPPGGAKPPVMAKGASKERDVAKDVLEINGQLFGENAKYGAIRPLAPGMKPEDAAKVTKNDGLDKIFFTDESGKSFVFYVEKAHFKNVDNGYLGRYNGKRIKVDAVDDENNTFREGFLSIWNWLHNTLKSSFGSEASNRISELIATASGTLVTAFAIKQTTTTAVTATKLMTDVTPSVGGTILSAMTGFLRTSASLVLIYCAAVGSISLFAGIRAHFRHGDYRQLDMVTGHF